VRRQEPLKDPTRVANGTRMSPAAARARLGPFVWLSVPRSPGAAVLSGTNS